ncbi:HAMP domain-containing histidine kinase [Phragmitibacter flavus]|uniref:histidine kinase n=1 Tax=Phragmitibacter flavus TaxID=2576071 RepID=A0A5R8K9F5_9BACT|nr:HAMP domain-containing sensor histidine kinase [Phragmitibacter flavus]TLD68927.1 HAMP domain-containing histidine kinase [Phragmitibacter flavus]
MNIFCRSIRWKLQLWHGLVLLTVLVLFGFAAQWLVWKNTLKRIDAELSLRASFIGAKMAFQYGLLIESPFFEGNIPPEQRSLFGQPNPESFYYAIWSVDGTLLEASEHAPSDLTRPTATVHADSPAPRTREVYREFIVKPLRPGPPPPPDPTMVLSDFSPLEFSTSPDVIGVVGCSLDAAHEELRQLTLGFTAAGGFMLCAGLTIGWMLTDPVIAPVNEIRKVAIQVANGNMAERIPISEQDSEMGELASVLNDTFTRLKSAFDRQARFTADASHELRTPIFIVLSQAQSALMQERSSAEYRRGFEITQTVAKQMWTLVDSLLLLARQDAGELSQSVEVCQLETILTEVMSLMEPLAQSKQVTLHLQWESAAVLAGPHHLKQILTNLLSNAIDYNQPGGDVRVSLCVSEKMAVLIVEDSGSGISATDLPHIFERFYRADNTPSAGEGHSGLGLAICRALVETYGGTIEVESTQGFGTKFTVKLPLA